MFLIFIAIQAAGPFVELPLNRPDQVERKDGKKVDLSILNNPWFEMRATAKLFLTKKFLLLVFFIGQAVFAEAVLFTYLARKSKCACVNNKIANILSSMVLGQSSRIGLFSFWHCVSNWWEPSWCKCPLMSSTAPTLNDIRF